MSRLPSLIAVVGPTASGKTDAALEIAKKYAGGSTSSPQAEIILADSRQVYIGMNIGTNKVPEARNLKHEACIVQNILYHGVNLVEPNEPFTVQQWKHYAIETIGAIVSRGHLPVIEGGTGLYAWALLDNLTLPEVPPDPELRKELEQQIEREGLQAVTQEILEKDPEAAAFLQLDNPRRVIRALEIIRKTGLPFSQQRGQGPKLYNDIRIGIDRPLKELDARISQRAKQQLDAGLENEVRALADTIGWEHPSMSGIGYIEWKEYFAGTISKTDVFERIVRHTQQYARAQKTWFRRDKNVRWVSSPQEAVQIASQ